MSNKLKYLIKRLEKQKADLKILWESAFTICFRWGDLNGFFYTLAIYFFYQKLVI